MAVGRKDNRKKYIAEYNRRKYVQGRSKTEIEAMGGEVLTKIKKQQT